MAEITMQVDTASYKHLLQRLEVLNKKFPAETLKIVQSAGLTIESNAKKNLMKELAKRQPKKNEKSTYHGVLASSIGSTQYQNGISVAARKKYAAYVEFGTGDLVDIPQGWEQYAAKFKGAGIRKVNNRARPYLIKAFIEEQPKIMNRIRAAYKVL